MSGVLAMNENKITGEGSGEGREEGGNAIGSHQKPWLQFQLFITDIKIVFASLNGGPQTNELWKLY